MRETAQEQVIREALEACGRWRKGLAEGTELQMHTVELLVALIQEVRRGI